MIISSKDNSKIKFLVKLFENKKTREESNLYIVEGYHMLRLAYEKNLLIKFYSLNDDEEDEERDTDDDACEHQIGEKHHDEAGDHRDDGVGHHWKSA